MTLVLCWYVRYPRLTSREMNVASMFPMDHCKIAKAFFLFFSVAVVPPQRWFCHVASSRELDSSVTNTSTCHRAIGLSTELSQMAINRVVAPSVDSDIVGYAGERVAAFHVLDDTWGRSMDSWRFKLSERNRRLDKPRRVIYYYTVYELKQVAHALSGDLDIDCMGLLYGTVKNMD